MSKEALNQTRSHIAVVEAVANSIPVFINETRPEALERRIERVFDLTDGTNDEAQSQKRRIRRSIALPVD